MLTRCDQLSVKAFIEEAEDMVKYVKFPSQACSYGLDDPDFVLVLAKSEQVHILID